MPKFSPNNTYLQAKTMYSIRSYPFIISGVLLMLASSLISAGEVDNAVAKTLSTTESGNTQESTPAPVKPTVQVAQDEAIPEPQQRQFKMIDAPEDDVLRDVFYAFRERFPGLPIESLSDGPYDGLFEVVTEARVIYVDKEVSKLFQGRILDLTSGVDLTEARLASIHMGLINDLGEDNMLVYKATSPTNRSITVFTDINCGYCRLLHSEIDTLLDAGIDVRYLMFPRAGLESDSRIALESVWCADNPQQAMTDAKAGGPIVPKSCDTPVEKHYALAQTVGLRGTPLIYLDNGTALPGYKEASVLVEMINVTEPMVTD